MASRNSVESHESRFTQGGATDRYENRLGWWERDLDNFQKSTSDLEVIIGPQYHKRPDKMAADYFGRSTLMWIILQYNSIVDINEEFVAGKKIIIPEPSRAQLTFLNKATGGVTPTTES